MVQQIPSNVIFDKYGVVYRVDVDDSDGTFLQMWIIHRNHCVGLARCWTHSGEKFELDDVTIFNNVYRPERLWLLILRILCRRPQRGISYRDKGLGSAFLEYIKRYAREKGYRRITGFIASQEKPMSVLVPWYRRHGFEVDDTKGRPSLFLDLTQEH